MKKILFLATLIAMSQTAVFAQKEKTVKESDVPVRYVKDFQNQSKGVQGAEWTMAEDSSAYMATFTNSDGERQAIRFTPKTSETRYYIEEAYIPHAIKDTIAHQFPKHKINTVYIRNLKGKMTYQCHISQKKGFLFWKKECDAMLISFETNSKLIEAVRLQD